jgi:hypothetical protein
VLLLERAASWRGLNPRRLAPSQCANSTLI